MLRALPLLLLPALLAACERADPVGLVNARVNARVQYQAEAPGHDLWVVARDAGDCEDYALAKREELMGQGFAAEDLQVLLLELPDGSWHAVLRVASRGAILDMRGPVYGEAEYLAGTGARPVCVARDLRPVDLAASLRC